MEYVAEMTLPFTTWFLSPFPWSWPLMVAEPVNGLHYLKKKTTQIIIIITVTVVAVAVKKKKNT